MRRSFGSSTVAWALLACAGCRPALRPGAGDGAGTASLVFYRTLTRADFRAELAVGAAVTEAERVGATTCAEIAMRPEAFTERAERSVTGETFHAVSLDNPIFFAVFGPRCSWWNPDGVLPEEDVLEHEQVHFALVELEARRMNGRAAQIVDSVTASGADLEATRRVALAKLHEILEQAKVTVRGRAELFDSQVYPHDRVRLRQWSLKVTSELETTDRFARGPQTAAPATVTAEPAPAPVPVSAVPAVANVLPAVPVPPASAAPVPPPAAVPSTPAPAATPVPRPAPSPTTSTGSFPD